MSQNKVGLGARRRSLPFVAMLAASLLAVTAACGSTGDKGGSDEPIKLSLSHNQATSTAQHQVLTEVADRIKEKTDGGVVVDLFPDSQLGAFGDIPEQFMAGTAVIGAVNAPLTATYGVPELAALNVPYVFDGPEDIGKFAASGLYDEWDSKLAEQGFKMIAFNWYQGERHIISNNPDGYPMPETMAGDAIRIPGGANWAAFFGDLPIDAQPLDGTEVYTAIQQGVINGAEGPFAQMLGWSLQELGKSITLTSHNYDISGFATSVKVWDTLSEDQQEAVSEAFLWGGEEFSKRTVADDAPLKADLEEAGITFVEADKAAYAKVAEESVTAERFPEYGDVLEDIKAAIRD